MDVVRCTSPQEFLDRTCDLRAADPLRTNVVGSVAASVANQQRQYEECFWWLVVDNAVVVAMAMRTSPHGLVTSPMTSDAARALAGAVAAADPAMPSLLGSRDVVTTVVEELARHDQRRSGGYGRRDLLYAIDRLTPPDVAGEFRIATEGDGALVEQWGRDFHEELALPNEDEDAMRRRVAAGTLYLWSYHGEVVSLAGHAAPVECAGTTVVRVGPVYTPPQRRGHGFAAAVSAALTDQLLRSGARVMLFADADNPTSNGVYQRLGYVVVDEVVHYVFT